MLWYIAFIAGLNLALGYLWAAYLRPCPRCAKVRELSAVIAAAPVAKGIERPPVVAMEAPAPAAVATKTETAPKVADAVEPVAKLPEPDLAAADKAFDAIPELEGVQAEAAPEPMAPVPLDPATGLATREHAEMLLARYSAADGRTNPVTVALIEVDEIEWIGDRSNVIVDERVLTGVSAIVRESLASGHTAARYAGQQLLLLVPQEDLHQATRRAEEIRQRIATTSFMAEGRTVQTTVTCAITELSTERSGPRLLEFLQEALGEAKRYGGNRTFMHDGNSPTPVVPPELDVAPQQLAI